MSLHAKKPSWAKRLVTALGWTRSSYYLLSAFFLTIFLIIYVWWPLAEEYLSYIDWQGQWWWYIDWLLIGIFLVMSLLIMTGANIRADSLIVFVGLVGGLVIESWGTQTEIWTYYTAERPPLWIIPAWPIASLSIDRLVRLLRRWMRDKTKAVLRTISGHPRHQNTKQNVTQIKAFKPLRMPSWFFISIYWITFIAFYVLMLRFVWLTLDKSLTIMALILVTFLTLTPTDHRIAVLTFIAGSGLGYFLERWGTTRLCWTYYTLETPPLFAVLAHGMAAVAFWRTAFVLELIWGKIRNQNNR